MAAHIIAQIHWNTKSEKFCRKSLGIFEMAIGKSLLNLQIESYWKIKDHMVATCHIAIEGQSKADKVFEMVCIAQTLTKSVRGNWIFMGPEENDQLEFECIFNAGHSEAQLPWAHLQFAAV